MKRLFLILILFAALASCSDKKKDAFYKEIYASITYLHETPQKLTSTMGNAVKKLKTNNDTLVDVNGINLLLDSTIAALNTKLKSIQQLEEVDKKIDLKNKAVECYQAFLNVTNNDFKAIIYLLGEKTDHKYEKASKILARSYSPVKESNDECKKAMDAFKEKYDVQEK